MHKCRACLCKSCMRSCCKNCMGRVISCEQYRGFEQVSVFDFLTPEAKEKHKRTIRAGWDDYGIGKERYRELKEKCMLPEYASIVAQEAFKASNLIAEYIILSVTQNKSYEGVEYVDGLGRIPCGRTDFYGYRRYFYSILDKKLKEMDKEKKAVN